ncbi:hypothetical protein, partial [Hominenteromicrobium sp.]|uniref:hypothetical protein n=1 Tax=Hominenteromicrobium sp. TaxID=3073581 RepID=UPI003AF000A9
FVLQIIRQLAGFALHNIPHPNVPENRGTDDAEEESEKLRKITMNVLTMQLNSITIMDLIYRQLINS